MAPQTIGDPTDGFRPVWERVRPLEQSKIPALVCIDGRCGSGKTTLARRLAQAFSCNVIHVDDFFLPAPLRTQERLAQPGGNIDRERLTAQVLAPLCRGEDGVLMPYDCARGVFRPAVPVVYRGLTILEGSYALHPDLSAHCALRVFLTCREEVQRRRIADREGPRAAAFFERWIPREEEYFARFSVEQGSDVRVDTSQANEWKEPAR